MTKPPPKDIATLQDIAATLLLSLKQDLKLSKNEQRTVVVAMMSQLARETTKQRSKAPAMPGAYALVGLCREK